MDEIIEQDIEQEGKHRGWRFTLNNYTEEEFRVATTEEEWIRYGVVGKEVAPTTGTPHLQGYYYCNGPQAFSRLKRKLPRAHFLTCQASAYHNGKYCRKEGNYTEWGEPPVSQEEKGKMGKKSWDDAYELAKTGEIEQIDKRILISHYSNLKRIKAENMILPPSIEELKNVWVWGPPGTGKSRYIREKYPNVYPKMLNKWWDGYRGQDEVIIEDVDPSHASWILHFLKLWSDHYSFIAEIKGDSHPIRPKRIFVTSNYKITEIWPTDVDSDPIKRRFTEVFKGFDDVLNF